MPYLRGSRSKPTTLMRRRVPIDYKLLQLQRQINRQKPELNNLLSQNSISTSSGYNLNTIYLTNLLTASSLFDELVLGDKFTNERLKIHFHCNLSTIKLRIVIYFSKKPATFFSPATSALGFTSIPDPAAFNVLVDKVFTPTNDTSAMAPIINVSLRGLMTTYNRSNSTLERGDLQVAVISEAGGTTGISWSAQHYFRNK